MGKRRRPSVFAPFVVRLKEHTNPSSMLVTFLNYVYFIPLTSYFGCKGNVSILFFAIALVYWAVLLFWQFHIPVLRLRPPSLRYGRIIWIVLTAAVCALVLYVSGRYTGFRLKLDIAEVGDIRLEARTYAIPRLISYLLGMTPVFLSISVLYWLRRRCWPAVLVLVAVYLLYYSIDASRSVFLFLFLLLAVYLCYRPGMYQGLTALFLLLIAASLAERLLLGSFRLDSLFVRRMLYVPANVSERYWNFFQAHPISLFRNGILGKLSFTKTYTQNIARLIGEAYGNPQTNENNGLLGDMLANLPVLSGLLLMPLILPLCFRLLDLAAGGLPERIRVSFCVYFAISFINGSWSTVLLSNGFLLACLLLCCFPREEVFQNEGYRPHV